LYQASGRSVLVWTSRIGVALLHTKLRFVVHRWLLASPPPSRCDAECGLWGAGATCAAARSAVCSLRGPGAVSMVRWHQSSWSQHVKLSCMHARPTQLRGKNTTAALPVQVRIGADVTLGLKSAPVHRGAKILHRTHVNKTHLRQSRLELKSTACPALDPNAAWSLWLHAARNRRPLHCSRLECTCCAVPRCLILNPVVTITKPSSERTCNAPWLCSFSDTAWFS
jgi:hypothetical protein